MSKPTVRMDPEYIDSILHWLTQGGTEKPDHDAAKIIQALMDARDGFRNMLVRRSKALRFIKGYIEDHYPDGDWEEESFHADIRNAAAAALEEEEA